MEQHATRPEVIDDATRSHLLKRSTWISIAVNVVLTIVQIVVGLLAHAQSLVADGLHSLADLIADFMVLFANRHSNTPADDEHPYGHGRIETVASLVLGGLLMATGAGFLWSAGVRIQDMSHLPPIAPIALWTALLTLAAKEGLFRYMLAVANRLRSPMLIANAWHARSDAASSLVVAIGIGGSLMGYRVFDLLAAAIVGFMIARMGAMFVYEALQELIDTGLDEQQVQQIRTTLQQTPGVIDVHELRTRRMAHKALVDAHILVDARISVSEGHRIAERARADVMEAIPDVMDVLVHVDVEDDLQAGHEVAPKMGRSALIAQLQQGLGLAPEDVLRVVLHFLGGRVEADVFVLSSLLQQAGRAETLADNARAMQGQQQQGKTFSAIRLHGTLAPN